MDLKLNIGGDSSEAVEALGEVGDATSEMSESSKKAWEDIGKAAAVAGAAVVAFGVSSVKAFMEADRVQKQLTRAAGEYAGVLDKQSDALERVFNVDGDLIKQSSTLLAQWGGVGAATEETTRAILDYAAATGQDAVAATQDLIRNVESGGTGLAKMGVHFETTGRRGDDLTAAVAALSKKFGGAAAADADSLHGQLTSVGLAFGQLQEDIGESIASMAQQTGVAAKLVEILRGLREFTFGNERDAADKEATRAAAWVQAQTELINAQNELAAATADGNVSISVLEKFSDDVARAQAKVDALKASAAPLIGNVGVTGDTNAGFQDREAAAKAAEAHAAKMEALREKNAESMREHQKGIDTLDAADAQRQQDSFADELAREGQRVSDAIDIRTAGQKAYDAIRLEEEKKTAEHAEKLDKAAAKAQEAAAKDSIERSEKKAKEAQQVGDQIGAAFVNALADQLAKLAAGGEFDAALFIGDILATAVGIAGTVIGTAFGMPMVGAAAGNLAAGFVRLGASEISRGNKKANRSKQYHEGGWVEPVGLPRYHSGSWIGSDERQAILQTEERVASRQEVRNAGGPAALDAVLSGRGGGGGLTLNVQAIDAKSMADTFTGSGADGLKQALRRGYGALPALMGRSPR